MVTMPFRGMHEPQRERMIRCLRIGSLRSYSLNKGSIRWRLSEKGALRCDAKADDTASVSSAAYLP